METNNNSASGTVFTVLNSNYEAAVEQPTELVQISHSFSEGLIRNENLIREIYTKVSKIKSFPPQADDKSEDFPQSLGIVSDMWGLTNQLSQNNRSLAFILEHLDKLI